MLKSWSIKNFKPIVDSGELQLAPVTVLAGRNSSGKSSLLQSILMIAQTLGSRLLDRPLLPNERIVQLGTYEDILSENTSSRDIEISLEFRHSEESRSPMTAHSTSIRISFVSPNKHINDPSTRISTILIGEMQLKTIFNTYQLVINFEEPDKPLHERIRIDFSAKQLDPTEKDAFLCNVREDFYNLLSDSTNYLGKLRYGQNQRTESSYLIEFAHFLPMQFIKKFNINERYESELTQDISELFQVSSSSFSLSDDSSISSVDIPDELYEELTELCEDLVISQVFNGETLGDLAYWYKSLQWTSESEGIAFSQDLQDTILAYLLEVGYGKDSDSDGGNEGLEKFNPSPYFEITIEQIMRFFTSDIRYLGPFRTEPGTIQHQFAPTSELDNVGTKGEYAATVYHANRTTLIDWYNPQTQLLEKSTLQRALDIWIQYLKIADHISTQEAEAIGTNWQVIPKEGRKPRSLREVGAGVGEILPILVMGLLSPANILLIIEQPELHMHPYVQARLGDFFMGLAKCKKQCLIETHSENLVSQLRLHIVEAGGLEKSDCMVYFVGQDEKGAAQFKQIEISPNGNIMNWPDGFFDETMLQEDRITAASLRKRAKKT